MDTPFEKLSDEQLVMEYRETELAYLNLAREMGKRGLEATMSETPLLTNEMSSDPGPCFVELLPDDQVSINGTVRTLFRPNAYHHLGKVRRAIWEVFVQNPDRVLLAEDFTASVETENLAPTIRSLASRLIDDHGDSIIITTRVSKNKNEYRLRPGVQIGANPVSVDVDGCMIRGDGIEYPLSVVQLELLRSLIGRANQETTIEDIWRTGKEEDGAEQMSEEDFDQTFERISQAAHKLNKRFEELIEIEELPDGKCIVRLSTKYKPFLS